MVETLYSGHQEKLSPSVQSDGPVGIEREIESVVLSSCGYRACVAEGECGRGPAIVEPSNKSCL